MESSDWHGFSSETTSSGYGSCPSNVATPPSSEDREMLHQGSPTKIDKLQGNSNMTFDMSCMSLNTPSDADSEEIVQLVDDDVCVPVRRSNSFEKGTPEPVTRMYD